MKRVFLKVRLALGLGLIICVYSHFAFADGVDEITELKRQMQIMQERLEELEEFKASVEVEQQTFKTETERLRNELRGLSEASERAADSVWDNVDIDAQVRVRHEIRNNFDFSGLTSNDDEFTFLRSRVGLGFRPTDNVRLYLQLQDSRIFGDEASTAIDALNDVDLHQGYVELLDLLGWPIHLRVGRQVLSYGDERLIGAFDWNNVGRTFDGVRLRAEHPHGVMDAFVTKINERDVRGIGTDDDQTLYGLYSTWDFIPDNVFDVYFLYLEDSNEVFFGEDRFFLLEETSPEDREVFTVGGRWSGKWKGLDYNAEGAFQTGEVGNDDLAAYAYHLGTGYTFPVRFSPRIGLQFNVGSGDHDPFDEESNTFSNLFPTNHKFYGYMDFVSWQNMREVVVETGFKPFENVRFKVDYHIFRLDARQDAFYSVAGAARPGRLGRPANVLFFDRDTDSIGSELDVTLWWDYNQSVKFLFGYGHFFVGRVVDKALLDEEDADFAYLQMLVNF